MLHFFAETLAADEKQKLRMRTLQEALRARLYLAAVYHDARLLSQREVPSDQLDGILARLFYVYYEGFAVVPRTRCRASFHDWRPEMGLDVALLHRTPNLIAPLSDFGYWRAAVLPGPRKPPFVRDYAWAEVLRLAPAWAGAHSSGEGGWFGCWYELSVGSGIAVNVGKSLRVSNRSELVHVFGLNISDIFARPVRGKTHLWEAYRTRSSQHSRLQNASPLAFATSEWPPPLYEGISLSDEHALRKRYFENSPWRLEANVNFCEHARRLGFDSVQIAHELCSVQPKRAACGAELVMCHASCLALRTRASRGVCVPGMPLRTGIDLSLECRCNATGHSDKSKQLRSVLNCAGNREALLANVQGALDHQWGGGVTATDRRTFPLVPGRARPFMHWLKECECAWCEGNHSHVDRLTQA